MNSRTTSQVGTLYLIPNTLGVYGTDGAQDTLRAVLAPQVVETIRTLLAEEAQFWTPYGATECLPVAVIEGRELLTLRARTEAGAGTCVGRPVAPNEVRIIAIGDDAIPEWNDALQVARGQVVALRQQQGRAALH